MLSLTLHPGEAIYIGDHVYLECVAVKKDEQKVRLAFDAPRSIEIDREPIRLTKIRSGERVATELERRHAHV